MVREKIHRVFVVDGGELVGVLSSRDLLMSIRDSKLAAPLSRYLTVPLFTIGVGESTGQATRLLEKAHISGLLVTDFGWPVGVFTQREALLASEFGNETSIDVVMTPRLLCLPGSIPVYRAAAHAVAMKVRRIVAMDEQTPHGIATGLDFARAAMGD
jgi:CBS domain-containing protein